MCSAASKILSSRDAKIKGLQFQHQNRANDVRKNGVIRVSVSVAAIGLALAVNIAWIGALACGFYRLF